MSPVARDGGERLRFLVRVTAKEASHLEGTTARLFRVPMTPERIRSLEDEPAVAERVDAFVARFGRLQDTLGDKLLPAVLDALGEPLGAVIDNLDRAERLGLMPSADTWLAMRRLRNQMIHEYVEDPELFADALDAARDFVPVLVGVNDRLRA